MQRKIANAASENLLLALKFYSEDEEALFLVPPAPKVHANKNFLRLFRHTTHTLA
jgi:hypothetical protein